MQFAAVDLVASSNWRISEMLVWELLHNETLACSRRILEGAVVFYQFQSLSASEMHSVPAFWGFVNSRLLTDIERHAGPTVFVFVVINKALEALVNILDAKAPDLGDFLQAARADSSRQNAQAKPLARPGVEVKLPWDLATYAPHTSDIPQNCQQRKTSKERKETPKTYHWLTCSMGEGCDCNLCGGEHPKQVWVKYLQSKGRLLEVIRLSQFHDVFT